MQSTSIRGILLDIEGTTSSISFVHEVMFPYVLQRLDGFVAEHSQRDDVQAAYAQIAKDAGYDSLPAWLSRAESDSPESLVAEEVRRLMSQDVKSTGLKALQGIIWERGFQTGELVAHIYPDVLPAIERWTASGIEVRIYSSGSIAAQKLFFGHVEGAGDCLHLLSGHYDTTIGGKKDVISYRKIADDWGIAPTEILFVSDIAEELEAAQAAGLQTRASVRPGNAPLPASLSTARIVTFDEICPH